MTQPTPPSDPIKVARENLFCHHNLSKLWNDNITTQSFFGKISGIFIYLWNRSTAVEADKTVEELEAAIKKCAEAVSKRGLTRTEAQGDGLYGIHYQNAAQQQLDRSHVLTAKESIKEFHAVFKKRCTQLNVTSGTELAKHAEAVSAAFKEFATTSPLIANKQCMSVKADTSVKKFHKQIFVDGIDTFAKQDLNLMTQEGFDKAANDLHAIFKDNSVNDIKATLKEAIIKVATRENLQKMADAYGNQADDSEKVVELKNAIKQKLDARLKVIEKRMAELRGPNGDNGEINDADVAMKAALKAKDEAVAKLRDALNAANAANPGVNGHSREEDLLGTQFQNSNNQACVDAHADAIAKNKVLIAAQEKRWHLQMELNKFAMQEGQNERGERHDVTDGLVEANLLIEAKKQANARAEFFRAMLA